MYSGLKRQKSISSQAASISAWCAVLDWQSIVAALSTARCGPASRSAALRKIAARWCQGMRDQLLCASSAALIARCTSALPHLCQWPRKWAWSCGITAWARRPVRTRRPPMRAGISISLRDIFSICFFSSSRSGLPGR